jgi:hypothetical protein
MEETKKELVDEELIKEDVKEDVSIDIDATSEVADETKEEQLELAYEDDEVGYIEEVKDEDILKEIAERASSLRAEDKKLIRELSVKYGLDFHPKSRCNECYIEQACKIYALIKEAKPTKSGAVGGYQLRDGLDVTYHGWHINADTLTKENAEKWIADGFPTKYFIKMPKTATK